MKYMALVASALPFPVFLSHSRNSDHPSMSTNTTVMPVLLVAPNQGFVSSSLLQMRG